MFALYKKEVQSYFCSPFAYVISALFQLVFSLSRFQGLSNKEIADNLNISIKAVEKHIGKSLKELRVSLAPYLKIFAIFSLSEVGLTLAKLFL